MQNMCASSFNACGCLSLSLDVQCTCIYVGVCVYIYEMKVPFPSQCNAQNALTKCRFVVEMDEKNRKTNSPPKIHFEAISFPFPRFSNKNEENSHRNSNSNITLATTLDACFIHTYKHTNRKIIILKRISCSLRQIRMVYTIFLSFSYEEGIVLRHTL